MNTGRMSGLRASRMLLALAVMAALAACGPGVGGSGTGPSASLPGSAAALPSLSQHADEVDGSRVQATLESPRLRVQLACPRLLFEGTWNGLPGDKLRFDGQFDGNPARPGHAEVQVTGSTLVVTLRDGTGLVLLGPVLLPSVGSLAPLAGCG
jgi:hypothetical protein